MQTTNIITLEQLREIIGAIYDQGEVSVKQAYSDFDSPTREFKTADALIQNMAYESGQKTAFSITQFITPNHAAIFLRSESNSNPKVVMGTNSDSRKKVGD